MFSILAYDAEDGLFLTEDRSLAFGFICQPLSGADPAVADRVNVLLNQDWPVDTLLQVSLWTSPDINATLALMQVRRIAQQQPFHKDMLHATVEFLGQGAQSALDGATGIRLRRMQVLVTVKLPMAGAMPTESDIRRAAANMYLLGQKAEAIEALKAERRLPLSEGGYSLLKTVHTLFSCHHALRGGKKIDRVGNSASSASSPSV